MRGSLRRVALLAAVVAAGPLPAVADSPPLPLCPGNRVGIWLKGGTKEIVSPRSVSHHQPAERRKILSVPVPGSAPVAVWLHRPGFKVAAGSFGIELVVPQPGIGACVRQDGFVELGVDAALETRTSGSPVPYLEITVWPPVALDGGRCTSSELIEIPDVPGERIETSGGAGACRFRLVVSPG